MSHEQLLEVSAPSPLIVIYVPRPSMKEQDGGCGQLAFSNSNISSVLLLIPIQQISNNVFKEQKIRSHNVVIMFRDQTNPICRQP